MCNTFSLMDIVTLLLILIPVIILEIALLIFAYRDWRKQDLSMPNRNLWLVLIIVLNLIGPILYFLVAPRYQSVSIEDDVWTDE